MTKEEYDNRLYKEFTLQEIALINFNIYYNPAHIEYYKNYHRGKYSECLNYLFINRDLLTPKHTPAEYKTVSEHILKNLNQTIDDDPVLIVRGMDEELYLVEDPQAIKQLEEIFNEMPEAEALAVVLSILNPEKYNTTT